MDGYLKQNLDIVKEAVKDDWDMLFIVDGLEGSGKSVLAQQIAGYLDPSLNLDRVVFSPDEFINAINAADKYQAIIYDEAFQGFASRSAMSAITKSLVGVLAQIRQKNLFVFIVLPCFFELDKYPAVWRSVALIHVYTKNLTRGFFNFYSVNKKKELYLKGKKFYQYAVLPDFHGIFPKGYYVNEAAYRAKKLKVLSNLGQEPPRQDSRREKHINILTTALKKYYSTNEIANMCNVDARTVNRWAAGKNQEAVE